MKRLFIVIICLVLSGIAIVFFFDKDNKATSDTQLSARTKEYLKKQQSAASSDWRTVNFDQKRASEQTSPQVIKVDTCLSLDVPFPITDIKHMGECFDQISIDLPRGMINVYTKKVG